MSSEKYLLVLAVVIAAAMVVAHPTPTPRSIGLSEAINRTVCPIKVQIDDDPTRIPRKIKLLKCAPDPLKWCRRQHIPDRECCQQTHDNYVMECVEITDTVLVYYPTKPDDTNPRCETLTVPVGCTCMFEPTVGRSPCRHRPDGRAAPPLGHHPTEAPPPRGRHLHTVDSSNA